MTNILILNGSPRKNGNTAVLINWLEENLIQKKREFKRYDLYTLQFKGCAHCDTCKKVIGKPGCVLQDDATEILDAITKADVIVMVSPIYFWSFSGCLGTLLDRFYCLVKNEVSNASLLVNKKMVGLFTSAGNAFDGMQYCDAALKETCLWSGANYLGTIGATLCTTPDELQKQNDIRNKIANLVAESF